MDSQQDSQPKDNYHMRRRPSPRPSKARLNGVSPKASSHIASAGPDESGLVKCLATSLTSGKSSATSEHRNSWPPVLPRSNKTRDDILQQGFTLSQHHNISECPSIPIRFTKIRCSTLDSKEETSLPVNTSSISNEAEPDDCLATYAGNKKSCLTLLGDNCSTRTSDGITASLLDEDDDIAEYECVHPPGSMPFPFLFHVKGRPPRPLDPISLLPITEAANPVPPIDWPAPPPPPVHDI